jgi:YgiT-type zinc finger domain-containing protein
MKCECCGAPMLEEHVVVRGGLVTLKNLSAWHCTECERVEYRSGLALMSQ